MFSTEHFIWLAVCTVLILALCFISAKKKWSLKTAGCVMTGICILSESSKILSNMQQSVKGGMHLDPLCLPFHLCSLMILSVLWITFGKEGKFKERLIRFQAPMGILGSFCALMIPTIGTSFASISSYQCFVYHAALMWFSIYLLQSGRAKLDRFGVLGENLLWIGILVVLELYINSILSVYDTNFLFLTRPPVKNLPYLNLDSGWMVYFIRLVLLGVSVISLFHLPFILHARKRKDR